MAYHRGESQPSAGQGLSLTWEGRKSFACGDVVPGCDARFVCNDDDELMTRVARHAAEVHGLTEIPDALMSDVRAHIVGV